MKMGQINLKFCYNFFIFGLNGSNMHHIFYYDDNVFENNYFCDY